MILYLDTETTSLFPGEICQLSYLLQTENSVVGKNFFFKVDKVDYGAERVHGFSVDLLDKLSCGKNFGCHIDEIQKDFESADVIIAHNLSFDLSFLRKEFERYGRIFYVKKEFCSMKNSTSFCQIPKSRGKGYKYPKLNELTQALNVSQVDISVKNQELFNTDATYHDARFDTVALYLAVNKLMLVSDKFQFLKEFI